MNNSEQVRWLKGRLLILRSQESKLFEILINESFSKEDIKNCVGAIIALSGYILRVSNAINRMEENPNLMVNLDALDAFKNKNRWR